MKRNILILAFMATVFGFYSCQNRQEDVLADIKGESMNFESFFEKSLTETSK